MHTNRYRYVLTSYREDGTMLTRRAIAADWAALAYWGEFQALRRGSIGPEGPASTTVEPVWHETTGAPCVGALKLLVQGEGRSVEFDVPGTWFDDIAQQGSGALVKQGLLQTGETFRYVVSAFPVDPAGGGRTAPARAAVAVREVRPALEIVRRPLGRRRQRPRPAGNGSDPDVPVIVPGRVIDQTAELARRAGAYETGGVLIGNICRDGDTDVLYVDVTAQVPARRAKSELTKLTFTPEAWTDVQDAITLRRRGEIMLGWWHSHSYMKETCKGCEKQKDGSCQANAAFMSGDDVALHRTTFPRAYSLALVVADSPCSGVTWAMFGWRQGHVAVRGFDIHRPDRQGGQETTETAAVAAQGENHG